MNKLLEDSFNKAFNEILDEKEELEERFKNGERSEKLIDDMSENFLNFTTISICIQNLEAMGGSYFVDSEVKEEQTKV